MSVSGCFVVRLDLGLSELCYLKEVVDKHVVIKVFLKWDKFSKLRVGMGLVGKVVVRIEIYNPLVHISGDGVDQWSDRKISRP